jgi:hypothetical protein
MPPIHPLVTAVRAAERHVDAVHDDDATTEQLRDQAVHEEGIARAKLIDWLCVTYGGAPVALVLADGSVVTYCDNGDGLSVVAPENVHRIGGEPAAGGHES